MKSVGLTKLPRVVLALHCLWFWALFVEGTRAPCAAQPGSDVPTHVHLVVSQCEPILAREEFVSHARVELLSTGVRHIEVADAEQGGPNESGVRLATVHVYYPECDDLSGAVNLRVSDRLTQKYVERALYLGDVRPEARARTLAVAAAELLRASFLELLLSSQTPQGRATWSDVQQRMLAHVQQTTPHAGAQAEASGHASMPQTRDERAPHYRLEWLAGGRSFAQGGSGDITSMVSLSSPVSRRIRLQLGGLVSGGGGHADRFVRMFEGAGRLGLSVSGGNELEIEVTSALELGWAKVIDTTGPDRSGFLSICSMAATLRAPIVADIAVLIGVQMGYVLTPIVARAVMDPSQSRSGFLGPMVGILLGLSGTL